MASFEDIFVDLINHRLPSPWDGNGDMCLKEQYDNIILECRNNDTNFTKMEGSLKGHVITGKLEELFELLEHLKVIFKSIPPLHMLTTHI